MTSPTPRRGSSVLGATGWQTLAQVAPLVVNLALTPFVITSLGRVAYGLWLVCSTFTQFLGQVDGGIGTTALRYFTRFAGSGDRRSAGRYARTLALMVLGVTAVTLLPAFLLTDLVVEFFHAPPDLADGAAFLLRTLVVLLGLGFLRNILAGILNAHQRYALTSITQLASYAVYAAGLVVVLTQGWGLHGMAYAFIAQQVVATAFIVPAALKLIDVRGVGFLSRAEIGEFLSVAWKVQLAGLMNMLSFQGVFLLVGRMAPRQVPDFGPGATFAQQMRFLPFNAVRPMQSTIGATIGAHGEEAGRARFRGLQRVWVIVIVGWVAVGAPASYHGVNAWLPLDNDLAGTVAAILLVGHLFALLPQVLVQWLVLQGRPEFEMWSSILTVAATVALAFATVGAFGALGVAVGTAVAQVLGMIALLVLAGRAGFLPRNPLIDVPWLQAAAAAALSWLTCGFTAALIAQGTLPRGAPGLVLVGLSAAPCLAAYLVATVGPRRVARIIRTRSLRD